MGNWVEAVRGDPRMGGRGQGRVWWGDGITGSPGVRLGVAWLANVDELSDLDLAISAVAVPAQSGQETSVWWRPVAARGFNGALRVSTHALPSRCGG